MSLPAIEFLRTSYTEVWAPSAVLPLIPFADGIRSIATTGIDRFPPDLTQLAGFDSIVSWYGTRRPEFVLACRDFPIQFLDALPPMDGEVHAVDFFAAQVGAPSGLQPVIPLSAGPTRDYAVIHPFSGSARKNWPLERYRELARQLPFPVQFTCGPEEQLPDAVRFESLRDLGLWLSAARVYVGNDSGITHLAAAAGVPVVALFGPTNPRVWSPRGPVVKVMPMDATPEEVARAVASLCR